MNSIQILRGLEIVCKEEGLHTRMLDGHSGWNLQMFRTPIEFVAGCLIRHDKIYVSSLLKEEYWLELYDLDTVNKFRAIIRAMSTKNYVYRAWCKVILNRVLRLLLEHGYDAWMPREWYMWVYIRVNKDHFVRVGFSQLSIYTMFIEDSLTLAGRPVSKQEGTRFPLDGKDDMFLPHDYDHLLELVDLRIELLKKKLPYPDIDKNSKFLAAFNGVDRAAIMVNIACKQFSRAFRWFKT